METTYKKSETHKIVKRKYEREMDKWVLEGNNALTLSKLTGIKTDLTKKYVRGGWPKLHANRMLIAVAMKLPVDSFDVVLKSDIETMKIYDERDSIEINEYKERFNLIKNISSKLYNLPVDKLKDVSKIVEAVSIGNRR